MPCAYWQVNICEFIFFVAILMYMLVQIEKKIKYERNKYF